MTLTSLGDLAQTFVLRGMTASLKADARIAAQELTTGRSADVQKHLGGELSYLAGIDASLSRLKAYEVAAQNTALISGGMQTALGKIDMLTDGLGITLIDAGNRQDSRTIDTMLTDMTSRFDTLISTLNTKLAGRSLFAGIASDAPALASSDTILAAVEGAILASAATSAPDILAAIDSWFSAPTGFATVGFVGNTTVAQIAISPDENIRIDVTAADPALRDSVKAMTIATVAGRGNITTDSQTIAALTTAAGEALQQATTARAVLAGTIGLYEARVSQAQARNMAEVATYELAASDLVSIDPYEAATRMEMTQNQLETLYSVTARLSRLSLVDFLR